MVVNLAVEKFPATVVQLVGSTFFNCNSLTISNFTMDWEAPLSNKIFISEILSFTWILPEITGKGFSNFCLFLEWPSSIDLIE
jgi:hypothetical protein